MLYDADRAEDHDDLQMLPSASLAPAIPSQVSPAPPPASRYGDGKSPNWLVIAAILIAHAIAIFALVQVRQHELRQEEARLSVVNLMPPPSPPPASETPPPPSSAPEIVAPPTLVQVPQPQIVQVATSPEPSPSRAAPTVAVAPAPSFAPPVAAPPSIVPGGDLSTQMVAGKPPRYPVESRRRKEQGTVVLSLTLGLDGAVEAITVSRSSGFARLDDAAKDAVKRWRWRPTIQQGQAVRVKGVVEIPFVLQGAAV